MHELVITMNHLPISLEMIFIIGSIFAGSLEIVCFLSLGILLLRERKHVAQEGSSTHM